MAGQFVMSITASLVAGVVLAFPYVFWELWRFTGRLFNRRDLYERGTELVPNPVMPHFIRREIQLEMFGWEMTYSWDLRREPQRGYFVCGYDPLTDTLWIRR
jgi:hypothetical protein